MALVDRLVARTSSVLDARISRRGFIAKTTIAGSAVAAAGCVPLTTPGSPFTFITDCPPGTLCRDGYTEFCCVINAGQNACPPNSVPSGWWRADYSAFCNGTRYYIDCNDYWGGGPCRCAHGCDNRKVYCNHFRYGQCNQDIPGTGVIACRVVTCTPPYLIPGSNCVPSGAVDNATSGHYADCAAYVPPPPPAPPPPPPTSPPAVLPSAAGAASPAPGEIVVLVRVSGGGIAVQHYVGGAWQGWQDLSLPPGRTAGSRIVAASRAPGIVDALVVGADRHLWAQHFEAGAWASTWTSLGGSYSSDPALAVDGTGLRAALRTTSGRRTRARRFGSAGWQGEEDLAGVSSSDPSVAPLGNGPFVAVRGTDSAMYVKRRGGRWPSSWTNLGGVTASDPALVAGASTVWLFVRGTNKGIFSKRYNGGWSAGWADLGGATCTSDPIAVFDGSTVWLFVRRSDNALWCRRRSGGSWSGWQSLGRPASGGLNADVAAVIDGGDVVVFGRAGSELNVLRISGGVPGAWEALPGVAVSGVRGASKA